MKIRFKRVIFIGLTVISVGFFSYYQNNAIETNEITISSKKLPKNFNDFTIVHLSDLHNKSFGKDQSDLVEKVQYTQPNIIVFTGDLVDKRNYNEEISLILMEKLVNVAPVYYVTGNHEWASGNYPSLEDNLIKIGVHVMRNDHSEIKTGEQSISVIGVDDPLAYQSSISQTRSVEESIQASLNEIDSTEKFKILLAHRPELFPMYSNYDLDVIFSGHAHGGQFRIPFLGGLIAPGQGFFPEYTSGRYEDSLTNMVVSRGLGNSIIPQRIFNRPEIIVVRLLSEPCNDCQ